MYLRCVKSSLRSGKGTHYRAIEKKAPSGRELSPKVTEGVAYRTIFNVATPLAENFAS